MKLLNRLKKLLKTKIKFNIKTIPYIVIAIVLLTVSTVSLISYGHLEKQTINTYYYFALNKLEKVKSDDEAQLSAIRNLCIQISFDDIITQHLYSGESDVFSAIKLQKSLRSYASFVLGVKTTNIYDRIHNRLETPVASRYTSEYYGIDLSAFIDNPPYTLIERDVLIEQGSRRLYFYTPDNKDYLIIVEVDLLSFQAQFSEFHKENEWELFVTDNNARPVYSSKQFLPETFEKIFSNQFETLDNYKIKRFNNTRYLYFSTYSPSTKCTYTTLIPYNAITNSMISQRNITFIIIILLILALLLVVAFFSVEKLKKPLSTLVKKSSLYDRYEYRAQIQQVGEDLKTYLNAPFPDNKLSAAVYSHLERAFKHNSDSYILLSFLVDRSETLKRENPDNIYKTLFYGVSNICQEVISKACNAVLVSDTQTTITMILNGNDIPSLNSLKAPVEECLMLVKEHLDISITAALNHPCEFDQLYQSYQAILRIRNYRYLYGEGCVLFPAVVKEVSANTQTLAQSMKHIISMMEENQFHKAKQACAEFVQSLRNLSVEQAHMLVMQFLILFTEYIERLNQKLLADDIDFIASSSRITSAETLEAVETEINTLIQTVSEVIITKKETSKHQKIAEEALKLIEAQFGDVNFCADTIAKHFNLSTLYLNRIFKQETGTTLAGSILKTRLNHTARLLSETSLSIKDIASQSGFINDSYFIVVFKKHFGCTPLNYRNSSK